MVIVAAQNINSGSMTEATIRHSLSRFRLHFSMKAITLLGVDSRHYLVHLKQAAGIPRRTLSENDEINVENDAKS
ncbi:hypothetical protein Cha6605_3960 [Chamaesiphon minutus PCC 6605]|uniref:Uncharacterized protein n=2 Tax=Chamaesiphon TaxID=217161 RepID=K9UIJ0_CHAP6|nr:hypothetical protein Cha6605_3960 [Chamaesiphon minutus PCC 6605]